MLFYEWERLEAEFGLPRAQWTAEHWELAAYRFEDVAEAAIEKLENGGRAKNWLTILNGEYELFCASIDNYKAKLRAQGKKVSTRAAVEEMLKDEHRRTRKALYKLMRERDKLVNRYDDRRRRRARHLSQLTEKEFFFFWRMMRR
jgi:hypothetical protein